MSVLVCFGDVRREVGTVAELDRILDGLAAANGPILVELVAGRVTLNVGVGRPDTAVVLFRDAEGRPWSARSRPDRSVGTEPDLEFTRSGNVYRFFARAGVLPSDMRKAARAFVRTPGARPTVVDWVPEGVDVDRIDGGDDGS